MADKKISQLSSASAPLAGTEVLPIVQSSTTVKVSVDNLTKGRTVNATTFDTDVAAAGVTLTGTTLAADGTDANININITPKGTGEVAMPKVNIDGGAIDGTAIGANSASSGAFTTVQASSTATATGFIPTSSSLVANGMYLPAANAIGLATNSGGRFYLDSVGKLGLADRGAPSYLIDAVPPNATPSGTYGVARFAATNWSGANNFSYADNFVFNSSTTTLNYNRSFQFNITSGDLNIDGVYWDGSSYVATSDTTINLQKNSTGTTQTSKLRPHANNTYTLGDGTMRWSEVYASNGTINTSDANLKTNIVDLDAAEKAVAVELKGMIKRFQFKDAVAKKGADARLHVGVIAQDVVAVFAKHGLDANRYGLYCENTVYVDEKGDRFDSDKDREGNVVAGRKAVVERGIRYDQLFAFVVAGL